MPDTFGATRDEWRALVAACPMRDLLPVVSNPNATIGKKSKLKGLGKTPSRYYGTAVGGIEDWTHYEATKRDINTWAKQPDYGICVQTRLVRAIDVDVTDKDQADAIFAVLESLNLPKRYRANSSKFLLAFKLPGEYRKDTIRTAHGIIEFLATGQQFIAAGTHPSGVRYEWSPELPKIIPELTKEQFTRLWTQLSTLFGTEPLKAAKQSIDRQTKIHEAHENDETAKRLLEIGSVLSTERDGRLHITCPFASAHTGDSADSSTTYFPANTGGYSRGHFKCLHAHCNGKTDDDFRGALGLYTIDFEPITDAESAQDKKDDKTKAKFEVQSLEDFGTAKSLDWLIRGLLPRAEIGVIYGEPGSGKTFWTLDLVGAMVARARWNNLPTRKSSGIYVIAEGAHGFRQRLAAYNKAKPDETLDFGIINAAPNLLSVGDVKVLLTEIKKYATKIDWIVIDTLSASTPGANENSGEDMGKVLAHCKALSRHTGAMVLLIHHTGKDASKGARGWSGIRGAVDVEIEIANCGDKERTRCATLTKLKDGGEDGQEWYFKLESISLGTEEFEGEVYPITSCVVAPADKPVVVSKHQNEDIKALIMSVVEATISGSSFDYAPGIQEVVDKTVALMDPPLGKTDSRPRKVRTVLDGMTDCFHMDDGRVSFLSPDEKMAAAKAANAWELLTDEEMLKAVI